MPVIIDEVETEVTVSPGGGAAARGAAGDVAEAASPETQAEELRLVIREILREEIERHMRLALPRR